MAHIIVPSRRIWTRQPQQAVEIDHRSPFGQSRLIWSGARPDVNQANGAAANLVSSTRVTDRFGRSLNIANGYIDVAGSFTNVSTPISFLWVGRHNEASSRNGSLICSAAGAAAGINFGYSSGDIRVSWPNGGGALTAVITVDPSIGDFIAVAASYNPTNGLLLVSYKNYSTGVIRTGSTSYGYSNWSVGNGIWRIGNSNGSGWATYGDNLLALVTLRDLPLAEQVAVLENPWQIFRPQVRRSFFDMGAGGGSTLNASASGGDVASGSASLSAQVALAAVGVSAASGSASLAASVPLSAVGLSVAAGSATPSATVTISAAGLAQAAGQAGLSASVLAQAAGAALASGNAELAAQLDALAAGAAQAGGSASLSGGALGDISASGAAIASGTAVLSVTVGLQAAGSALASGTAAGSANAPGQVSAAGGAVAGGSGVMSAQVSITAAGFVQSMGQGAFSATVPLSAFGAVTASGYARLTVDNGVVMVRAPSGYRTSLIAYNSMRPWQSITIRPISLNTRR